MPIEIRMVLGFFTALLVSFIAIPPIVRVSHAKNLLAAPNGRTCHQGHVPALGGVAIFAAVVMGTSLFIDNSGFEEARYILAAMVIIFFIGLKDDLVNVKWRKKLGSEVLAALIVVVLAGVRIGSFHGMLGIETLPYWFSVLFSSFVFVALINCFNLLDGIDGLASGMGISISLIFGFWLWRLGFDSYAVFSLALTGSLVSFYGFNVFGKHNKLFMGDTGSLLLGFLFAVFAIKVLSCQIPLSGSMYFKSLPTMVMGLMIIPIIDTLRVFSTRILKGKSPFSADKTHLHHVFLKLRFSHLQASTIIILMNLLLFGLTWMMRNMSAFTSSLILFALATIFSLVPCYLSGTLFRRRNFTSRRLIDAKLTSPVVSEN
jgi:UDP-N-acetylmuramyl pentapeptide phosphotransferase/UDP-N-acetylglucosamine-1-phosphate transferase